MSNQARYFFHADIISCEILVHIFCSSLNHVVFSFLEVHRMSHYKIICIANIFSCFVLPFYSFNVSHDEDMLLNLMWINLPIFYGQYC